MRISAGSSSSTRLARKLTSKVSIRSVDGRERALPEGAGTRPLRDAPAETSSLPVGGAKNLKRQAVAVRAGAVCRIYLGVSARFSLPVQCDGVAANAAGVCVKISQA